jgi:hypothetical protein
MEAKRPDLITTHMVPANHIERLRGWLLGVLLLGLLGTGTELALLSHYEQPLQLVPVVLMVLALATLVWHAADRGRISLNAMLILMILFVLAGFAGFFAHFQGSAEFQLELDPSMSRRDLVVKVLQAKAPPLLAPGMMIQLGLLGLAYVLSDARYRQRIPSNFGTPKMEERQ